MLAFRRRRLCLPVVLALAPLGCQSILGIDSDRPYVPPDAGLDAGPDVHGDAGAGLDVAADTAADGGADTSIADSGTPPVDASDASDATGPLPDASDAAADAPPPTSFSNPVQVDASALFNANSVITTAIGGATPTPMDGNGANANNDFPTASEVVALGSNPGQGLPDNGFFRSDGSSMPDVQLAWNNTSNVLNSIVLSSTSGQMFTIDLPNQKYMKVQLYATGAGGGSTLNYTLNYVGGGTTSSSMSLPDWCVGTPGGGQHSLASVYRVENGVTLNTQFSCHIYALDLNPDQTQMLDSVTFWDTGLAPANFVFYGATAW